MDQDGEYAEGEVEDYIVKINVPERHKPVADIEMGLDGNLLDIAPPASLSSFTGIGSGYDDGNRRLGTSSLHFGGNGDHVSLDNNDLLLHKAFTARRIALWVYCENNSDIRDIYDEGDNTNGIGLRINNGNIELGVQNANRIQKVAGAMPTNQWVFVTGMFNNGKLSLYIDGALAAENANVGFTSVPIHAGAAGLGATNGTNAFDQANNNFNGWIDELKIYCIALLESEIEFMSGSSTINQIQSNTQVQGEDVTRNANPITGMANVTPGSMSLATAELVVYPNPSKGVVSMITAVKHAGALTIQVTDLQGKLVYEKAIAFVEQGFQQVSLSNLNLKAATYIVKVMNREDVQARKLIIQN